VASLVLDNVNDVIMKYVGIEMGAQQIIFMRFLSSTLVLLPLVARRRDQEHGPAHMGLHVLRSFLLYVGMVLWCFGLRNVPIAMATSINFTIPIFVLIFARIFLKEGLGRIKIIATLVGFLGTLVVIDPFGSALGPGPQFGGAEILIISAMLFALLDVLNKRFVAKESTLNMLFYSGLFVALFSAVPAVIHWTRPSMHAFFLLGFLGITGNLILYCLLRAFSYAAISAIAPYRYLELIISAGFGYLIFSEIPKTTTYIGALLIGVSTCIIMYETRLLKWFGARASGPLDKV
jgi:drug/metabolite transporter (DMT)-like permease